MMAATNQCEDTWSFVELNETSVVLSCTGSNQSWSRGASSICDVWYAGGTLEDDRKYTIFENGSLKINDIGSPKNPINEFFCGPRDHGVYLCESSAGQRIQRQVHSTDKFNLSSKHVFLYIPLAINFLYLLYAIIRVIYKKLTFKDPFNFNKPERVEDQLDHTDNDKTCWNTLKKYPNTCWNTLKTCLKTLKPSGTTIKKYTKLFNFCVTNILFCILDIFTDIIQAAIHFLNEDYGWCVLTSLFIIMPFILSLIMFFCTLVTKKCGHRQHMDWSWRKFCRQCLWHLPFLQLIEHLTVLKEIKEKQKEIKEDDSVNDLPAGDQRKINHKKYLEKYWREIAAIESTFQKFKVIECIGENVPQSVLQIGIILKNTPNSFKKAEQILSNPTIFTSILSMVTTFTGLYLKMPYGSSSQQNHAERKDANETEMQPLNNRRPRNESNNFPYKSSKSYVFVVPIMLGTIFPRVCNLALIFTFHLWWVVLICVLFLLGLYVACCRFIFKRVQKKWLESDMFYYSVFLSIITPCVRLYPKPEASIIWPAGASCVFHFILLLVMTIKIKFLPTWLSLCDVTDIYLKVCLISSLMLGISILFSILLVIFSDGQTRQLFGLLSWPSKPLSCPQIDLYKKAIESNWLDVLKHLIQEDIDRVKGKPDWKIEDKLRKEGRINWPLKKGRTAVHKACESQKVGIVKLFLDAPSYLGHFNVKDADKKTPLHIACNAGLKKVVELILNNTDHIDKETINSEDRFQNSPLMEACKSGKMEIVKLFLDASDAKLNHLNKARSSNGQTAFMYACETNNEKLIKSFLECNQANRIDFGAKRRENGSNVWHILANVRKEKKRRDDVILDKKIIIMNLIADKRTVLTQDLHINDPDDAGRTPYLVSCMAGLDSAFKWFEEHHEDFNIDLNAQDHQGLTSHQLACKYKAIDIIKEFVKRGAYGPKAISTTREYTVECGIENFKLTVEFDAQENPTNARVAKLTANNDNF